MKPIKVLGLTVASLGFLGMLAVGGPVARAEDAVTDKETPTEVQIIDQDEGAPAFLHLDQVPARYYFKSTIKNMDYDLKADATGKADKTDDKADNKGTIENPIIKVVAGKSSSKWEVKATVESMNDAAKAELTLHNETAVFPISSFTINDNELLGTGADSIVFKAGQEENKDVNDTGTGPLIKSVTKAGITFKDADNTLKKDDQLDARIRYRLYDASDPAEGDPDGVVPGNPDDKPTPPNSSDVDTDIDDDKILNEQDDDVDGDGKTNDKDDDIDDDTIPNDQDDDADGDGELNDDDTTPNGYIEEGGQ